MIQVKRAVFILYVIQGLLLLEAWLWGPAQWVLKYDLAGQPNSIVSLSTFLSLYVVYFCFVNGVIFFVRRFLGSDFSLKNVSVPNKEYWSQPAHAVQGHQRLLSLFDAVLVFVNANGLMMFLIGRSAITGWLVNALVFGAFCSAGLLAWYIHRLFAIPR
jgi:hypothetical protein